MRKRSIMPSGDVKGLAKSLMDLVTGNPIVEDISPIRKEKDPVAERFGRLNDRKHPENPPARRKYPGLEF